MRTITILAMLLWSGIANAQDAPSKTEDKLYRASQVAWISAKVIDDWTTVVAINNPVHVDYKYCNDGSDSCKLPVVVEETVSFREAGPASWFGIQDPAMIVLATTAFEAGVFFANDRFLYKRGGVWRKVAIGLNLFMAGNHFYAGLGNASKMRSAKLGLVPAGAFSVRW